MNKSFSTLHTAAMFGMLLCLSGFAYYDNQDHEIEDVKLSGLQFQACIVAFDDFKKRGYSLENYEIIIGKKSSKFEVIFVPHHPKWQPTTRGGGNIYGKEIHYHISESGIIENISFAR